MNYKKIVLSIFVFSLFFIPAVYAVQAIEVSSQDATLTQILTPDQIDNIMVQISDLQKQLDALKVEQTQTTSTPSSAPLSATTGAVTADDVKVLQEFLISKGYSILAGATGYYGNQTAAAVTKFQIANGLPGVGVVGPRTKAIIKEKYGIDVKEMTIGYGTVIGGSGAVIGGGKVIVDTCPLRDSAGECIQQNFPVYCYYATKPKEQYKRIAGILDNTCQPLDTIMEIDNSWREASGSDCTDVYNMVHEGAMTVNQMKRWCRDRRPLTY